MNIDFRETDFINAVEFVKKTFSKFKDIEITKMNLEIGDIEFPDYDIIIERKTLGDLSSSIKDGRYSEQGHRLSSSKTHNHNIYYLIEGEFAQYKVDKTMIYSSIVSLQYFKGFSVWRSMSIDETALMICNMAYKLNKEKDKLPFYSNNLSTTAATKADGSEDTLVTTSAVDKDYCSVVKKVKKDNITTENIGEIMLCQIPGVSSASALAILAEFKTLPNLIKAIDTNEACLNNICTTDANGKSRKISKAAIATIIKFLKS
jgi:ERCC4-type nuclease